METTSQNTTPSSRIQDLLLLDTGSTSTHSELILERVRNVPNQLTTDSSENGSGVGAALRDALEIEAESFNVIKLTASQSRRSKKPGYQSTSTMSLSKKDSKPKVSRVPSISSSITGATQITIDEKLDTEPQILQVLPAHLFPRLNESNVLTAALKENINSRTGGVGTEKHSKFAHVKPETVQELHLYEGNRITNFINPTTLIFKDSELEEMFIKSDLCPFFSISGTRSQQFIFILLLAIFVLIQALSPSITAGSNTYLWIGLGFLVSQLFFAVFIWTSAFYKYQTISAFALLFMASIAKTVLTYYFAGITQVVFPIMSVACLRGRFVSVIFMNSWDLFIYNLYAYLVSSTDMYEMVQTNFYAILVLIAVYLSCYGFEINVRDTFIRQMQSKYEQERTDSILHNIFPARISTIIQNQARANKQSVIAFAEPAVTILFCDLLDFYDLCISLTPNQLVSTLNVMYSAFDLLCARNFVCKMETVGKTYVACAGLPDTNEEHAIACVQMAQEMIELTSLTRLHIRIGINSGAVISGVVGLTRPQYCLFGDVINTASRHQSTGLMDRISCSKSTFDLVEHAALCLFEKRNVFMKGKGNVDTFVVIPLPSVVRSNILAQYFKNQDKPASPSLNDQNVSELVETASNMHDDDSASAISHTYIRTVPYVKRDSPPVSIVATPRLTTPRLPLPQVSTPRESSVNHSDSKQASADKSFELPSIVASTRQIPMIIRTPSVSKSRYDNSRSYSMSQSGYSRLQRTLATFPSNSFLNFLHFVHDDGELNYEMEASYKLRLHASNITLYPFVIAMCYCVLQALIDLGNVSINDIFSTGSGFSAGALNPVFGTGNIGGLTISFIFHFFYFVCYAILIYCAVNNDLNGGLISREVLHAGMTAVFILNLVSEWVVSVLVVGGLHYYSLLVCMLFLWLFGNIKITIRDSLPVYFFIFCFWVIVSFSTREFAHISVIQGSIYCCWILFIDSCAFYISYRNEYFQRRNFSLSLEVEITQAEADQFLYSLLPRGLVEQIQSGSNETGIADEYHNISLLYSDICGFTAFSASSNPVEVVQLLTTLFSAFDRQTDKYNVYKIQTIGDAYVCAAGLPFLKPGSDASHAKRLIMFGLKMLKELKDNQPDNTEIAMRVGIHTGSIVAGVVGTKKLRFDIWGVDSMVANMCESTGVPGCILLSESTASLVDDEFDLQHYQSEGGVPIKVPGTRSTYIQTYLLRPDAQKRQRSIVS